MTSRTFTLTPGAGKTCERALPFDPKEVFGRTPAPVVVTLNGYGHRGTVTTMDDARAAAGARASRWLRVRR